MSQVGPQSHSLPPHLAVNLSLLLCKLNVWVTAHLNEPQIAHAGVSPNSSCKGVP